MNKPYLAEDVKCITIETDEKKSYNHRCCG